MTLYEMMQVANNGNEIKVVTSLPGDYSTTVINGKRRYIIEKISSGAMSAYKNAEVERVTANMDGKLIIRIV